MRAFIQTIGSLPANFWILNLVSMLEKLAYWSVLLQLPIYIAQKDEPGGLGWEQSAKGWIYLFWALAQNLIPIFAGTFSDRLGRRKMLYLAFSIAAVAYVLIGTQREFYPFLFSVILLGLGLGIFKPSLQGALAVQMNEKNSSTGWGVYFMLLNVAVFAGPPLSKWLKEIAWEYVFVGSALIILLNFLVLLFFRDVKIIRKDRPMISQIFKKSIVDLSNKKLLSFIGLIAGFMLIYMQFYETLPNFIYDWSDTSGIASWLGLPQSLALEGGQALFPRRLAARPSPLPPSLLRLVDHGLSSGLTGHVLCKQPGRLFDFPNPAVGDYFVQTVAKRGDHPIDSYGWTRGRGCRWKHYSDLRSCCCWR